MLMETSGGEFACRNEYCRLAVSGASRWPRRRTRRLKPGRSASAWQTARACAPASGLSPPYRPLLKNAVIPDPEGGFSGLPDPLDVVRRDGPPLGLAACAASCFCLRSSLAISGGSSSRVASSIAAGSTSNEDEAEEARPAELTPAAAPGMARGGSPAAARCPAAFPAREAAPASLASGRGGRGVPQAAQHLSPLSLTRVHAAQGHPGASATATAAISASAAEWPRVCRLAALSGGEAGGGEARAPAGTAPDANVSPAAAAAAVPGDDGAATVATAGDACSAGISLALPPLRSSKQRLKK